MSRQNTNTGTDEEPKSDLDLVEEALVGTHQQLPGEGSEDDAQVGGTDDDQPPVPGHRSP